MYNHHRCPVPEQLSPKGGPSPSASPPLTPSPWQPRSHSLSPRTGPFCVFHVNGLARRVAVCVRRRSLRTARPGALRGAAHAREVRSDHSSTAPSARMAGGTRGGTGFKQGQRDDRERSRSRWETLRSHRKGDLAVRQARGTAWDPSVTPEQPGRKRLPRGQAGGAAGAAISRGSLRGGQPAQSAVRSGSQGAGLGVPQPGRAGDPEAGVPTRRPQIETSAGRLERRSEEDGEEIRP